LGRIENYVPADGKHDSITKNQIGITVPACCFHRNNE
jgi:hypothetical protein